MDIKELCMGDFLYSVKEVLVGFTSVTGGPLNHIEFNMEMMFISICVGCVYLCDAFYVR
jgi:hypothetical protein